MQLQTQSHKAKAEESRQELIPVSGPATQEREAAAGGVGGEGEGGIRLLQFKMSLDFVIIGV